MEFLSAKHVRLNESVIGLGAILLHELVKPKTVDEIWQRVRHLKQSARSIPDKITLDDVIETIDFLFSLGLIALNDQAVLRRCD